MHAVGVYSVYKINDYVCLVLGNTSSRIRTPATHRTVVQTAHSDARTRQDCGNVAAGQAERHAEVAHNYGNDYGPNFGLKRSQTQFSMNHWNKN